nr:MAG: hypothetical protein [Lake Baikal virophage 5]
MSILSYINSPLPTYKLVNSFLASGSSIDGVGQTIPINDGSTEFGIYPITSLNSGVGISADYVEVPAGTYNLQMICAIKPPINATLTYAQLFIVDSYSTLAIASSQSKSFISAGNIERTYWTFNESQRVVLTADSRLTMTLSYTGLNQNSTMFVGVTPEYQVPLTAQFILTPTF